MLKYLAKQAVIVAITKTVDAFSDIDVKFRSSIITGVVRSNNAKTTDTFEHLLLYSQHTDAKTIGLYISAISGSKEDIVRFGGKFANSKFYFLSNTDIVSITKQLSSLNEELVPAIQEGLINQHQFHVLHTVLNEVKSSDKRACFASLYKRSVNNPYLLTKLVEFVSMFPEFQRLMVLV